MSATSRILVSRPISNVSCGRSYYAAKTFVDEGRAGRSPASHHGTGVDAAALAASLIENIARLEPDEVSQRETFANCSRQAALCPPSAIPTAATSTPERALFDTGEQGPVEEWLAQFNSPDTYAPRRGLEGVTNPPWPRCLRPMPARSSPISLARIAISPTRIRGDCPAQASLSPDGPTSLFWTPITISIPGSTRRYGRRRAAQPAYNLAHTICQAICGSLLLSQERRSKNGAYLDTSVRSPQHAFTWFKSWQHLPQHHGVKEPRSTQARMSPVPYRQSVI
ncbi:MAG: hypothetical protein E5X41_30535 [Mesorhizobium sp.]|nr:MAG: hypothetical protein E5X41_30535 [Mesorhizobium sp.]